MHPLPLWLRPALLALIWSLLTAFTLTQLATVGPLLRGEHPHPPQARQALHLSSARR